MASLNSVPSVSIVIPALNEAAHISRAVQTAWEAGALQVVVADGGSEDETRELAASAGATVVAAPHGRAIQQNAGAASATGDVILFQHADNWCDVNSIGQIQAAMQDKAVLGGAFRQRIEATGLLYRCLERGNALRVRLCKLPYGDQGIFLRREVFEQLGGFPEVALMEDVLLMQAFRRLARPVLLPGPHHVNARRWQHRGVVGQTLRNWRILWSHALGTPPERLAKMYGRHDEQAASPSERILG